MTPLALEECDTIQALGFAQATGGSTMLHAGTLIVLLITATELWVAADSHVVAIGARQTGAPALCKIYPFGPVFYAEAGLLKDTAGRFSAAAMAAQAAAEQPTVPEAAGAFARRALEPLVEAVRTLRALNPRYYEARVRGKAALQVAFFGVAGRGPQLAIRRFVIHEAGPGGLWAAVDRFDCPGDCAGPGTWAFLGGSEVLPAFLEAHPRYLPTHGARATLQRLMALEARAHPGEVTPPVDILRIGPKGPAWVQRKSSCPPLPSP